MNQGCAPRGKPDELHENGCNCKKYQVDEYVATIFPGNRMKKTRIVRETGEGSVTFDGLTGGTEEYVITGLRNNFCTQGYLLFQVSFHIVIL